MMPPQPIRRFIVADAMILVVATAIGIVVVRAILPNISAMIMSIISDFFYPPKMGVSATADAWQVALLAGSPLLAAWTVAILLLRSAGPGRTSGVRSDSRGRSLARRHARHGGRCNVDHPHVRRCSKGRV